MIKQSKAFLCVIFMLVYNTPNASHAQGFSAIFEYYNMAFNALDKAGGRTAAAEFNRLYQNIENVIDYIDGLQSPIHLIRDDPDFIKDVVDSVLLERGAPYAVTDSYVVDWTNVSAGLNTAISLHGYYNLLDNIVNLSVSASKFNDLASEIGQLASAGSSDLVAWASATLQAGYYSSDSIKRMKKLSEDAQKTLDQLMSGADGRELEMIIDALMSDAAEASVASYSTLMGSRDGQRVIVQQKVMKYLSELRGGQIRSNEDLYSQNLYYVEVEKRRFRRDRIIGGIKPGSELFPVVSIEPPAPTPSVPPRGFTDPPIDQDPSPLTETWIDVPAREDVPVREDLLVSDQCPRPDLGFCPPAEGPGNNQEDEATTPPTPEPQLTWAGRMSLTGRVLPGGNSIVSSVGTMVADGTAPQSSQISFSPEVGTITPARLIGRQASDSPNLNHLIWGSWSGGTREWSTSQYSADSLAGFFVYGALSAPDIRPRGAAAYTGIVRGDLVESWVSYTGFVTGDFGLTVNFTTGSVGGWFAIGVDFSNPGVPANPPEYVFVTDITNARFTRRSDRLEFSGDLGDNYSDASGSIAGFLFGSNGSELGGTYEIIDAGGQGSSNGVFVGWETNNVPPRPADPNRARIHARITTNSALGIADAGVDMQALPTAGNPSVSMELPRAIGGGTVTTTETFASGAYSHTSWGRWEANETTPPSFQQDGYWVAGDSTPASSMQRQVGTATYTGNIAGDFVSSSNANPGQRETMAGRVNLTANFDSDRITGSMRMNSPSTTTGDLAIEADIAGNRFNVNNGNYGMDAGFFGPSAEEIGGTTWAVTPDGAYNGVFRARPSELR